MPQMPLLEANLKGGHAGRMQFGSLLHVWTISAHSFSVPATKCSSQYIETSQHSKW